MSDRCGETDDLAGLFDERRARGGLTGWMASVGPDVSTRWRRRLGSGVVFDVELERAE